MTARRGETGTAFLFLAPFLLLFAAFVVAPAAIAVWMSLHEWTYLGAH
jgi:multiple sugar transport system permease protein